MSRLRSWRGAFQCNVAVAALIAAGVGTPTRAAAQDTGQATAQTTGQATNDPRGSIPELVVTAPKPKPAVRPHRRAGAPATGPATQQAPASAAEAVGPSGTARAPLQQIPVLGKTGTPLSDLPQSVVIVPQNVVSQQGGVSLGDAVHNVSGINLGGSSSYGFFDRFTIRGLDARIYSDGFPDGDEFNGFPHSMNGVQSIEVLKGPGSALFGSTTPGGSINIIHYLPSATPGYGITEQIGSWGSWMTSVYATGPTTVPGLTYRVDGLFQYSDGFRGLDSANYELRPEVSWNHDNHITTIAVDVRHIERTPDSYGILYFNGHGDAGTPLTNVPNTAYYSTPFAHGNQDIQRFTATDSWWIADYLTVNNRLSLLHRDVSILRNSGGGTIVDVGGLWQEQGRQLREQTDHDYDFTYQLEPLWKFHTGPVMHSLLTGAQVEWQSIDDNRLTANLPNIANIFAPVIPETSTAGLTFLRNATNSGMMDELRALYLSTYATDQIDVTDQWKVRLGVRQEHWYEGLTPQVFVPGRYDPNGDLFEPGVTETRIDTPTSWSVGTLYKIFPGLAPFAGVSKSYLTNFNSESTQSGIYAPESGLEYEAGVKLSTPDDRLVLTAAAFEVFRNNVFTENTATVPIQISFNAQDSRGIDADLQVKPLPQWTILANAITQTANLTGVPLTPSQVGNWPVGVPAHILNIWSTYDFAVAGIDGFKAGAGLSYNDRTYANTGNTSWIPPSTVIDAMLDWSDKHWDAQFGVKNIGNVAYYTIAQSAGGYVGQPRTYYLKASWRY